MISNKELRAIRKDAAKVYKEIEEYNKNKVLGIDTDMLHAFVDYGKLKWKINPEGHVGKIRKIIDDAEIEFQKEMEKLEEADVPTFHRKPIYEKATKTILEVALEKFDYKKERDNPQAGPAALGLLAREVANFLVVQGGRAAFKHSQMLSRLAMLRHSGSLMEQSRNTES